MTDLKKLIEIGWLIEVPEKRIENLKNHEKPVVIKKHWTIENSIKEKFYKVVKDVIDKNAEMKASDKFKLIKSKIKQLPIEVQKESYLEATRKQINLQEPYYNGMDEESIRLMILDCFSFEDYIEFYDKTIKILKNENIQTIIEDEADLLLVSMLKHEYQSLTNPNCLNESKVNNKMNFTYELKLFSCITNEIENANNYWLDFQNEVYQNVSNVENEKLVVSYIERLKSKAEKLTVGVRRFPFANQPKRHLEVTFYIPIEKNKLESHWGLKILDLLDQISIPKLTAPKTIKPSTFKTHLSPEQITTLWQKLIDNGFIHPDTKETNFKHVFGEPTPEFDKVVWIDKAPNHNETLNKQTLFDLINETIPILLMPDNVKTLNNFIIEMFKDGICNDYKKANISQSFKEWNKKKKTNKPQRNSLLIGIIKNL